MTNNYVVALLIGVVTGLLSCFFAQGGIANSKLFIRLTKTKGKWHKYRLLIIFFHLMLSIYGAYLYGISQVFFEFMMTCSYLTAMTATDIRNRQIPDDATIFYAIIFIIIKVSSMDVYVIINSVMGMVLGVLIPAAAYFINKNSIGLGDIKLIACISISIGFPNIIYVLAKAFFVGGIYAVVMLLRKRVNRDTELPMVPFILVGAII